jgi:putative glutamine amidotransferase
VASNGSRSSRPLIGVSCYLEQTRFGVWNIPAVVLPRGYADGVLAAGGVPMLLPPVGHWDVADVSRLDGLVLAGGPDVDPARYHQAAHERTAPLRPERDGVELRLAAAALEIGLPVLGVCRGMQVLNIALGGTLRQHLPDVVGSSDHLPTPGVFGRIEVKLAPDSRVAEAIGHQVTVSCHHHQALDRLGRGLTPVGWAPDGTVEAVELPGDAFAVGVQWHPEEDTTDARLFEALVVAA